MEGLGWELHLPCVVEGEELLRQHDLVEELLQRLILVELLYALL